MSAFQKTWWAGREMVTNILQENNCGVQWQN